MKGNISRYTLYVGAILSVLILSGCAPWEWLKDKLGMGKKAAAPAVVKPAEPGAPPAVAMPGKPEPVKLRGRDDKVLVTMGNVPIMTIKSFEEEYGRLLEENPQLKQMEQFIPDLKSNILNSLINQEVMDKYIVEKGINQTPDYQADLARFTKSLMRMLNSRYFAKEQKVSVTDAEVKKFYEENKDKVPGLIVSHGGVRAVGVKFEKEEEAKAFFDKVKGKSKEFDSIAKKEDKKIQDFKLVNDKSMGMNAELRKNILALKKFPTVEMIKVSDKEFWVVNATGKEEKAFRAFEDVKEALRADLEREKEMKAVEAAVEKLKGDYKVIIDEEAAKAIMPPPVPEPEVAEQALAPDAPQASETPKTAEAPRATKAA